MTTLRIFATMISVIALASCGKSYRLTKNDLDFNPYKVGDTLLFQSDKYKKDTLIIVSVDKQKLHEKSYSFFSSISTYVAGNSWETLDVSSKFPNNHGEAWNDILTLRTEPNSTKTITFNFSIKGATWYGNSVIENDANKVLNLPTLKFDRGSQTLGDVIVIPSSNEEYKNRDDFVDKLYWSKSKGLVGFDKLSGEKWTVIKK